MVHFQQNADHIDPKQPDKTMYNTVILARERNCLKRKILESLCIDHKRAHLCNTGVSVEMPAVWNLCSDGLASELAKFD